MFTSEKSHVISGLFSHPFSPTPSPPHQPLIRAFVVFLSFFFLVLLNGWQAKASICGRFGGERPHSVCAPMLRGMWVGVGSSRSPHWLPADTAAAGDYVPGARVSMEACITAACLPACSTGRERKQTEP